MLVTGYVTRRRSMGRCLAFMELQTEGQTIGSPKTTSLVSTAFREGPFLDLISDDFEPFPCKKSSIPYGARVECHLQQTTHVDTASGEPIGPPFEVLSWRILENPRDAALSVATIEGGGVSCTKYLQARGSAFLLHNETRQPKTCQKNRVSPNEVRSDYSQAKALRATVFADFIVNNILKLDGSDMVLDIAGGKGQLSVEISLRAQVPCTVIDPLIRKPPKFKRLYKSQSPIPQFRAHEFRRDDGETLVAVQKATCLVGLHPDEPTEDIIDLALTHGLSAAVVPCCVFPTFFPLRQLSSGASVRTYDDFVKYLLEKDSRLQLGHLQFEGKNQVVYLA